MSDKDGGAVNREILHVIENGADVEADGFDKTLASDRVHILPGGYVELIHKNAYQRTILPREKIQHMSTFTKEYEDEEWW